MRLCPAETPEGGSVGVVKNLALSNHISNYSDISPIIKIIEEEYAFHLSDYEPNQINDETKIFINGDWMFLTLQPDLLIKKLRTLRRMGIINIYVSIWDIKLNNIYIFSDQGRSLDLYIY